MFDTNSSGFVSLSEAKHLYRALDVEMTNEKEINRLNQSLFFDSSEASRFIKRGLSFEEFRKVVIYRKYARLQKGRFHVAVSLAEAESIRGLVHMANWARR